MGYTNQICMISGLTIVGGDNVVCVPLKTAKINKHNPTIYANSFFRPVAFPIYGRYDGYGSIEDIRTNFNTKFIINKFLEGFKNRTLYKRNITLSELNEICNDEFVDTTILSYANGAYNIYDDCHYYYTFILRDVYDYITDDSEKENWKDKWENEDSDLNFLEDYIGVLTNSDKLMIIKFLSLKWAFHELGKIWTPCYNSQNENYGYVVRFNKFINEYAEKRIIDKEEEHGD